MFSEYFLKVPFWGKMKYNRRYRMIENAKKETDFHEKKEKNLSVHDSWLTASLYRAGDAIVFLRISQQQCNDPNTFGCFLVFAGYVDYGGLR